ncbi:MAG: NAD(P)-dependent oxidoreductase [Pseudomonas sp.]|uniref:NAD(P)-dependent oxidoreductase n=1 Tax=Pseudomonas sp. TaxID=306 RepID=UPI003982A995
MKPPVGFIGLGNMGEGMASNIARAGFALSVRDIRQEPLDRLAALGATPVGSCYEIGQCSNIVCIALFDEAQVRQACLPNGDDQGVFAGMAAGGIVTIHSTVPAELTQELAQAGRARGITVIDAPMTGGGGAAADAGKLTFFLGGDEAAIETARPVLAAMAQHLFHVGEVGAGSTTKILSNFLAISNVLLVREAQRLARSCGIDEERWRSVINAGGVGSSWVSNNWHIIQAQEEVYTTGAAGMVAMASKDLHLARQLHQQLGVAMPILDHLVDHALPELGNNGLTR